MATISMVQPQSHDGYAQLVRELQAEFGCVDVDAIAERIVQSEAADFYWEARVKERYLGQYPSVETAADDVQDELVRVACLSRFAGEWHVGSFVVNGNGQAADLLWRRSFDRYAEAHRAFRSAR